MSGFRESRLPPDSLRSRNSEISAFLLLRPRRPELAREAQAAAGNWVELKPRPGPDGFGDCRPV
jgi:hypothetical protein